MTDNPKPQSWLEREVVHWQGYAKSGEKPPSYYTRLFEEQHGYTPDRIRFTGGGVLVGPILGKEDR
jgi:hypothetical protein